MKTMAPPCAFLLLLLTVTSSAERSLRVKREGTTIPTTTVWNTPKHFCVDKIDNCDFYHKTACSGAYEGWARDHCPLYCGFCVPGSTTTPLLCEDTVPCHSYGDDICTNVAYAGWRQTHCRKFCNLCVNGAWGSWTPYGACSQTCGTGTQSRTRACDSPAPTNGGSTCPGVSTESQTCTTNSCATCEQPADPQNGKFNKDAFSLKCVATCNAGYEFEGKAPSPIWRECDNLSNIWFLRPDIPNCVAICTSPCQNGGTCDAPYHCDCAPGYTGSQCETRKQCDEGISQYVTVTPENGVELTSGSATITSSNPTLSVLVAPKNPSSQGVLLGSLVVKYTNAASVTLQDETGKELTTLNLTAPAATLIVDGYNSKLPIEVVLTRLDANSAVTLTTEEVKGCSEADVCVQPADPQNGMFDCHQDVVSLTCVAMCNTGYEFEDKSPPPIWRECDNFSRIWRSGPDVPNCVAICASPCQNGGTCDAPNHCVCAKGYTGSQCETPQLS